MTFENNLSDTDKIIDSILSDGKEPEEAQPSGILNSAEPEKAPGPKAEGEGVVSDILNGSIEPKDIIEAGEKGTSALLSVAKHLAAFGKWNAEQLAELNRLIGEGTVEAITKAIEIMRADTDQTELNVSRFK